jgi:hypothetical protein
MDQGALTADQADAASKQVQDLWTTMQANMDDFASKNAKNATVVKQAYETLNPYMTSVLDEMTTRAKGLHDQETLTAGAGEDAAKAAMDAAQASMASTKAAIDAVNATKDSTKAAQDNAAAASATAAAITLATSGMANFNAQLAANKTASDSAAAAAKVTADAIAAATSIASSGAANNAAVNKGRVAVTSDDGGAIGLTTRIAGSGAQVLGAGFGDLTVAQLTSMSATSAAQTNAWKDLLPAATVAAAGVTNSIVNQVLSDAGLAIPGGLSDIPQFAEGGVSRTRGLAVVDEGELHIPKDMQEKMFSPQGGGSTVINLNISLSAFDASGLERITREKIAPMILSDIQRNASSSRTNLTRLTTPPSARRLITK